MLTALAATLVAAWNLVASRESNRVVDRFHWYEHSIGVASQRRNHGWDHAGEIRGLGSCVVLHHSQPEHQLYGQNGGYQVAVQLPADISIGERFLLSPVPADREGEPQPHDRRYTLMLPGEFTASTFGDHMGNMVARSEIRASAVTVKEMTDDHVVLHAHIDVTIPEFYNLQLNRDFILRRVPKNGG